MKRRHLIELHEQDWYPAAWRRLFQRGLGHAHALTHAFEGFYEPFQEFLGRFRSKAILDLCSGSGDAAATTWSHITDHLEAAGRPVLVLSDLYPNTGSYERLKAKHPGLIDFFPEPVNALHPPPKAPPIRTLFNSFHHFRPEQARAILQDAARNADGIAIFEVTGRTWKNMLQTLFILPFAAAFVVSVLLRPWRPANILWGLLIPIIPLTAVIDGVVSNFRTYTVDELRETVATLDAPDFEWQIDTVRVEGMRLEATFLLGWRKCTDENQP